MPFPGVCFLVNGRAEETVLAAQWRGGFFFVYQGVAVFFGRFETPRFIITHGAAIASLLASWLLLQRLGKVAHRLPVSALCQSDFAQFFVHQIVAWSLRPCLECLLEQQGSPVERVFVQGVECAPHMVDIGQRVGLGPCLYA